MVQLDVDRQERVAQRVEVRLIIRGFDAFDRSMAKNEVV